ncbi:MAG: deoxyribonuclease V [Candidatus Scalindua sp.]|nr:deoxyribonuclease V [Candidatus Scalindua sp.]
MKYLNLHPWNVDYKEAVEIQKKLREKVTLQSTLKDLDSILVAGADVSYDKENDRFIAGVVVFVLRTMEKIEESTASGRVVFPYIPGLLSFRESPILIRAFIRIKSVPNILMLDAQGIAHPRGIGLASHIGLLFDTPSIGCAKTRLIGEHDEVDNEVGDSKPLLVKERQVGAVLRTKKNVKPVFVSPGHKIDMITSIQVVLKSCRGYRLPEPTRQAHNLVSKIKKS